MAARRTNHPNGAQSQPRPATTPEARENQLIAAAVDLAAKQLADGTASAQVITHYLKLGSSREQLEQEKMRLDGELAKAKIETMASMARSEALMKDALNAFRSYSGKASDEEDEEAYDD